MITTSLRILAAPLMMAFAHATPAPQVAFVRQAATIASPTAQTSSLGTMASTCYGLDDSSADNAAGSTLQPGVIAWFSGFEANGGSDVITEVSTAFGSSLSPTPLTPGQAGVIGIWDDPTNDFDPSDAVLVYSAPITTSMEDTELQVAFPVPNVAVSGTFFVGFAVDCFVGDFPAPLDLDTQGLGASWFGINSPGFGSFNMNDLSDNSTPPVLLTGPFDGVWMVRAVGLNCGDIGTVYCTSNANSIDAAGSSISATGSDSLAAADLTLAASNAPLNQAALFFYGPTQGNLPLSCGRLCVTGGLIRMPIVSESLGEFSYDVDFATYGADFASLGTVNFQCWYRDPANAAACGDTSNLSDGIEVVFLP